MPARGQTGAFPPIACVPQWCMVSHSLSHKHLYILPHQDWIIDCIKTDTSQRKVEVPYGDLFLQLSQLTGKQ